LSAWSLGSSKPRLLLVGPTLLLNFQGTTTAAILNLNCAHSLLPLLSVLADRTNGRAYATVLGPSTVCL